MIPCCQNSCVGSILQHAESQTPLSSVSPHHHRVDGGRGRLAMADRECDARLRHASDGAALAGPARLLVGAEFPAWPQSSRGWGAGRFGDRGSRGEVLGAL